METLFSSKAILVTSTSHVEETGHCGDISQIRLIRYKNDDREFVKGRLSEELTLSG